MSPRLAASRTGRIFSVTQRLVSGKDAIFGGADLAPLQAEIIEQLIVEDAEMLLTPTWRRAHTKFPPWTQAP